MEMGVAYKSIFFFMIKKKFDIVFRILVALL